MPCKFFRAALLAVLLLSAGGAAAAVDDERVGTWDPQPFAADGAFEFIVTQESPLARLQQRSKTAQSFVFYFRHDGAILLIAQPNAVLGPRGARTDKDGSVIFADFAASGIKRLAANGQVTTVISGAPLTAPKDVAIAASGDLVIADFDEFKDTSRRAVVLYRQATKDLKTIYAGKPLLWPHGVDIDRNGDYVIADVSGAIFRVTPTGQLTTVASGVPLIGPLDIKVQADGSYVVPDNQLGMDAASGQNNRPAQPPLPAKLFRVTPDGEISVIYQKRGSTFRAVANHPAGGWIVVDSSGGRAGGDGQSRGALIRVYPDGTARVLHEGAPFFNPAGVTIIAGAGSMAVAKQQSESSAPPAAPRRRDGR